MKRSACEMSMSSMDNTSVVLRVQTPSLTGTRLTASMTYSSFDKFYATMRAFSQYDTEVIVTVNGNPEMLLDVLRRDFPQLYVTVFKEGEDFNGDKRRSLIA